MTDHLRPEEFVDAMDGASPAQVKAHLATCVVCQEELATLRAITSDVQNVEAHEPSPLFWDHFSARVRAATDAVSQPAPWWSGWVRPASVLAGVGAIVVLMVMFRPSTTPNPESATGVTTSTIASLEPLDDGPSWGMVVSAASELTASEALDAALPAAGTADAMIDELTAAQRDELIRLLQKEIGAS